LKKTVVWDVTPFNLEEV